MPSRTRLGNVVSNPPRNVCQLQGGEPHRNAQGDVKRDQGHGHSGEVLQISDATLQEGQEQKRFERLLHPAMWSSTKPNPENHGKCHGHEHRCSVQSGNFSDAERKSWSILVASVRSGTGHDGASHDGNERRDDEHPRHY